MERQDVERKAEDPPGYLSGLHPLIFCLGNCGHVSCEWNQFFIRWSVVGPPDRAKDPASIYQNVEDSHCVAEREILEIGHNREDPAVTLP